MPRRVRLTGQVPAVIYGGKGDSQALEINAKQVAAILRSASGHNTIFKIKIKDDEQTAILKDWLVDPAFAMNWRLDGKICRLRTS